MNISKGSKWVSREGIVVTVLQTPSTITPCVQYEFNVGGLRYKSSQTKPIFLINFRKVIINELHYCLE